MPLVVLLGAQVAPAVPAAETHHLRVTAWVSYRCFGGIDGKRRTDERTKAACDNQTTKATLMDEVKAIDLKDEPDPEDSPSLAGSWLQTFKFKGRTFTVAVSLFKDFLPTRYRLRIVAQDDEPQPRSTAVFVETPTMPELNPVSVDYGSVGKKEEIRLWVTVQTATSTAADAGVLTP